jgi:hypothetical protein
VAGETWCTIIFTLGSRVKLNNVTWAVVVAIGTFNPSIISNAEHSHDLATYKNSFV